MERDEEVIKMAREADLDLVASPLSPANPWRSSPQVSAADCLSKLERFAALVEAAATEKANERANASWASMCEKMVAAERERARRCAIRVTWATTAEKIWKLQQCAAAIRARGSWCLFTHSISRILGIFVKARSSGGKMPRL